MSPGTTKIPSRSEGPVVRNVFTKSYVQVSNPLYQHHCWFLLKLFSPYEFVPFIPHTHWAEIVFQHWIEKVLPHRGSCKHSFAVKAISFLQTKMSLQVRLASFLYQRNSTNHFQSSFCDSSVSKCRTHSSVPIITFTDLKAAHSHSSFAFCTKHMKLIYYGRKSYLSTRMTIL
jgi:hypothetical protein